MARSDSAQRSFDPDDGLRVDTIQLAFEAASIGLGVALGRKPLVDRDLESGALVEAAFDTIDSGGRLLARQCGEWRNVGRNYLGFRQWILAEAEQFSCDDATPPISTRRNRRYG